MRVCGVELAGNDTNTFNLPVEGQVAGKVASLLPWLMH